MNTRSKLVISAVVLRSTGTQSHTGLPRRPLQDDRVSYQVCAQVNEKAKEMYEKRRASGQLPLGREKS